MNEKSTELHFACSTCDVVNVNYLLANGADINRKNNDGDTPLHYAKNEEIVNLLLKNNVDISIKNVEGKSPFINYCMLKNTNLAKLLLKNDADINEKCLLNKTALHYACSYRYDADPNINNLFVLETIKFLIDHKINVNATDRLCATALHYACGFCSVQVILMLLNNGANVNQYDISHKLPLHYAMERNKKEIIKILYFYDTKINYANNIVRLYYCNLEMDDIKYVRYLIFYLCKNNFHKMTKFAVLYDYRKYFRYFAEILNLNDEYIFDNIGITYYGFIAANTLKLCNILYFKKLDQSMFKRQIYDDNFMKKFPIYGNVIRRKFKLIENQFNKHIST